MNKILLVDNNSKLALLLKEFLNTEGFDVLIAHDEKQVLTFLDNDIDLILLNITTENSSIEILKTIRQIHQIPIIVLTARINESECILGLELGADDYLSKPFNNRELIARIRAILRRSYWSRQQKNEKNILSTLTIGTLYLNPGCYEASINGHKLELTGTEFALLYLLAKHIGQVISREYLSQKVLGKCLTPFDRAIDMHISNLRRKLPKRKDNYPWFKTLRGRGYLMVTM